MFASQFRRVAQKFAKSSLANGTPIITSHSVSKPIKWMKIAAAVAATAAATTTVVLASSDVLSPPSHEWSHDGFYSSYDTASLRRGFEVYRNVCATCHSMNLIAYRNLVGVSHTEEQAKALAQSIQVKDGPNDKGEMFERPGKLSDRLPAPYPNEEYARAVNNGAYPPDLSLISKARPGHEDYLFALLTGYKDAPAGVQLRDGLYYNPYFAGGAIGMPKPLNDGQVEYEDGTPATESQMAKDVVTFLAWAAEPRAEERKRSGTKALLALIVMTAMAGYRKRFYWNLIKNRKIEYRD